MRDGKASMNSGDNIAVIKDVSCTSSLPYDTGLRASRPNPVDFGGLDGED